MSEHMCVEFVAATHYEQRDIFNSDMCIVHKHIGTPHTIATCRLLVANVYFPSKMMAFKSPNIFRPHFGHRRLFSAVTWHCRRRWRRQAGSPLFAAHIRIHHIELHANFWIQHLEIVSEHRLTSVTWTTFPHGGYANILLNLFANHWKYTRRARMRAGVKKKRRPSSVITRGTKQHIFPAAVHQKLNLI